MPISHISLNTPDIVALGDFYSAILAPLGYKQAISLMDGKVRGYSAGRYKGPDFWLASLDSPTADGSATRRQTGVVDAVKAGGGGSEEVAVEKDSKVKTMTGQCHLAFSAGSREEVRRFWKAGL